MRPNTCKCNWIPMVFGRIDPIWGIVTHYRVECDNCGRRGKCKKTREEAIEEWNTNGPDKTGIMN